MAWNQASSTLNCLPPAILSNSMALPHSNESPRRQQPRSRPRVCYHLGCGSGYALTYTSRVRLHFLPSPLFLQITKDALLNAHGPTISRLPCLLGHTSPSMAPTTRPQAHTSTRTQTHTPQLKVGGILIVPDDTRLAQDCRLHGLEAAVLPRAGSVAGRCHQPTSPSATPRA
jgi:hypothetical protein